MRVETDIFNSEIFGIRMGNIIDIQPGSSDSDIEDIIAESRNRRYQHISVKVPVQEKKLTNVLCQNGFKLVDTQVMYKLKTQKFWGGVQTLA